MSEGLRSEASQGKIDNGQAVHRGQGDPRNTSGSELVRELVKSAKAQPNYREFTHWKNNR